MSGKHGENYRQVKTCANCDHVFFALVGDEQVPYCNLSNLLEPHDGYMEALRKLPATAEDYVCDSYKND